MLIAIWTACCEPLHRSFELQEKKKKQIAKEKKKKKANINHKLKMEQICTNVLHVNKN